MITKKEYNDLLAKIHDLEKVVCDKTNNGGKGSGDWGHVGRPGQIGGSGKGGVKITGNVDDYWQTGTVGDYKFEAKVYDEGSDYGIDAGRISKLQVKDKDNKTVAAYDRGWDVKPTDARAEKAVYDIKQYYGEKKDRE